jgi:tetratricopeptide (TPR) repeat protein
VYFRFVNVLIHILCSCSVFWLANELSRRKAIAAVAGSIFLVHPIQTQAVTYITQRFESLAALFMISAAAGYVRMRREGNWRWLGVVLACAVAAGTTKETGMVLPVWLAFIEILFFSRIRFNVRLLYAVPLFAIVAWPAWKTWVQSGPTLTWVPWHWYFASQGFVLVKYIQLVIFPAQQFLLYDIQPASAITLPLMLQWLLILMTAAAAIWFLRVRPLIGFGVLSFFILLLPVTILPLPDLIFEHRIYPALCGLSIAAAAAIVMLPRRVMMIVSAILILGLSAKTVVRNGQYNDPIAFFENHREQFPEGAFALVHLGNHYLGMGEVNKAFAVTMEARRHEDRFNVYYQKVGLTSVATNLGLIHLAKQEYRIAEAEAFRALAVTPDDPLSLLLLGNIYLETDRNDKAKETFARLVRVKPEDVIALRWYREASLKAGDPQSAVWALARIDALTEDAERFRATAFRISPRYHSHVVFIAVFLTIATLFVMVRCLKSDFSAD